MPLDTILHPLLTITAPSTSGDLYDEIKDARLHASECSVSHSNIAMSHITFLTVGMLKNTLPTWIFHHWFLKYQTRGPPARSEDVHLIVIVSCN